MYLHRSTVLGDKMKTVGKIIAYPVMMLSGVGILLCLSFSLLALTGRHPSLVTPVMFGGIFVVWVPTIILSNWLTRDFKQKDFWKAALRGCPAWMRTGLWVVIGCVFIAFFLPILFGKSPGDSPLTFTLFPMMFYAVSFCVMYSLINIEESGADRRCLNGHAMSPSAKFCEECGSPAAPVSYVDV